MNRIVKVHERISPGFLTPFIFILSYTFEDKYIKGQGPVADFRSHGSCDPHPSDSIIRKNGYRMVSCQATCPFYRNLRVCFGGSDPDWRLAVSSWPAHSLSGFLISLYGSCWTERSPAGRRFWDRTDRHGSSRFGGPPFCCQCPYYTGIVESAPVNPIPQLFYL